MSKKELSAYGVGDAPAFLAEEGLELAIRYFEDQDIDPVASYEATKNDPQSELAEHWYKAEKTANRILLSSGFYDNSMISLEIDKV
jgi:hypothetical protein